MIKKIVIGLTLIVLLLISLVLFSVYKLWENVPADEDLIVTIQKNGSSGQIVRSLNKSNLFEPAWIFKPIVKLYSLALDEQVHAGTYRFNKNNKNYDVLRSIFSGKQLAIIKVTFPEGITLADFASVCSRKLGIDSAKFVKIANSDSIRKEYGIKFKTVEGYFYPATYNFFWKSQSVEIIRTLLDHGQKIWDEKFAEKAANLGKSRHETLTLSSIVEAETPSISERPRVSGVYVNRLKKGRRLEADPTVQYALNNKKKLSFADLEVDNPYNTYRNYGLPPGPINSPSTTSIEAALAPEKHDFIYFVARGDGSSKHNFAKSFGQHEKFRQEYKKNRKLRN